MDYIDLKFNMVQYFMDKLVITAGGTEFDVPRVMIAGIEVVKDFDNEIYPLWYLNVNIPLWLFTEMKRCPDEIFVSMNLQYRMAMENEDLIKEAGPLITDVSGRFKAILPDTTQMGDSSLEKEIQKENEQYNVGYSYGQEAYVELALYNTNAYNASFNKINAVLTSTNLTDALTYCLNKAGINNVLLDSANNNSSYREFKILPQTPIQNIMRIIDQYKFHNNGSVVFFDLVDSYILSKTVGCRSWKNNEFKTTHLLSLTEFSESLSKFEGVYINSQEKYNVIAVPDGSFTTTKVDSIPLLNSLPQKEYLTIITKNALFSILTPNKEFILNVDTTENKQYNGRYRITRLTANLVPSGEFLDPTFELRFAK